MKTTNWKDVAEFIGIFAIVLSLIFVGLQIKQSYEIAIAGQYQARFDSYLAINSMRFESDVGLRVAGEGIREAAARLDSIPDSASQWLEDTPVEEIGYRYFMAHMTLKQYDNIHYQYRSGFLDELSWQDFRRSLAELLTDVDGPPNFVRILYEYRQIGMHPAFREEIASIIQDAGSRSED